MEPMVLAMVEPVEMVEHRMQVVVVIGQGEALAG